jgi:Protein of unknown function (DUF2752)
VRWRHLRPGELNHELIWLLVSSAAAFIAWAWLYFGLRTPICLFHEFTGIACPGCGATRCVRHVFRGDLASAFLMNPMVFLTGLLLVVYDLYAALILALRLPRLRFDAVPRFLSTTARIAIPLIILLNWAWLIYLKV